MKIYALLPDYDRAAPQPYLVADSALVTRSKPLFLPEWDDDFRTVPALAFRIGKLGKTVARRFASRYFDGVAPALLTFGASSLASLRRRGEPLQSALSFDGAVVAGTFLNPREAGEVRFSFYKASGAEAEAEIEVKAAPGEAAETAALLLEQISARNLMRNGDLLLIPLSDEPFPTTLHTTVTAFDSSIPEGDLSAPRRPELLCRIK